MQAILKLDLAGQPRGWLTLQEAVSAYARGDVVYGIGDTLPPVFGGIQRLSGIRSRIDMQPIIALEGRIMQGFTPPLCNRTSYRLVTMTYNTVTFLQKEDNFHLNTINMCILQKNGKDVVLLISFGFFF